MVSLFFGEFHRLGWISRVLLLLSSFLVAFVLNFGRTITLTYLGGKGGTELTEEWHDVVGNVSMGLCLVSLWLLAEGFNRWRARPTPLVINNTAPRRAPFPFWFAVAGLAWLGTSEAATEGWYAFMNKMR